MKTLNRKNPTFTPAETIAVFATVFFAISNWWSFGFITALVALMTGGHLAWTLLTMRDGYLKKIVTLIGWVVAVALLDVFVPKAFALGGAFILLHVAITSKLPTSRLLVTVIVALYILSGINPIPPKL